ncbi:MAG: hypothetical protein ACYYK0_03785 [Candidatus Eutrophobiaceae bacterium]
MYKSAYKYTAFDAWIILRQPLYWDLQLQAVKGSEGVVPGQPINQSINQSINYSLTAKRDPWLNSVKVIAQRIFMASEVILLDSAVAVNVRGSSVETSAKGI